MYEHSSILSWQYEYEWINFTKNVLKSCSPTRLINRNLDCLSFKFLVIRPCTTRFILIVQWLHWTNVNHEARTTLLVDVNIVLSWGRECVLYYYVMNVILYCVLHPDYHHVLLWPPNCGWYCGLTKDQNVKISDWLPCP